jgi:hypothetical protein
LFSKKQQKILLPSLDTAINKAAEEPWTETETKINDLAQANGYEAYSRASKQNWFAGGFAWKWYVDDYKEKNIDYTSRKPALETLKKWYK